MGLMGSLYVGEFDHLPPIEWPECAPYCLGRSEGLNDSSCLRKKSKSFVRCQSPHQRDRPLLRTRDFMVKINSTYTCLIRCTGVVKRLDLFGHAAM